MQSDNSNQQKRGSESRGRRIREMYKSDRYDKSDIYCIKMASAEVITNTVIRLTHQATYLLRKQLEWLERNFFGEERFPRVDVSGAKMQARQRQERLGRTSRTKLTNRTTRENWRWDGELTLGMKVDII